MKFWLGLLICSAGTAGLFFLDRDKSTRNSKALWLPVIWILIAGSRPVSAWWATPDPTATVGGGLASTLDGNPVDAAIYAGLLVLGVIVLFLRGNRTAKLLKVNSPVVIYMLYCMISIAWSPFPQPAFKRWTKALGDLVMVVILLTDGQPIVALRRLFSKIGFILLPASVFLIRYSDLGRTYDHDFQPANTGVTTNKNSLGLIVFIISLGVLWNVRNLLRDKKAPNRDRHLLAQCVLLAFGIYLLQLAHSATAIGCFVLGGGLMLATSTSAVRNRPGRVLALCSVVVLAGGLTMLFGGQSDLSNALGRGGGLSGRTDIWAASIASAGNPLLGAGFESFWNASSQKVAENLVSRGFSSGVVLDLVSAHNGYLEVYLDLGLLGVCLIVLILLSGYRNASQTFRRDPELGGLMVAYIVTNTFYSITEAGFRMLTPSWIFLLLAVVSASGIASGVIVGAFEPLDRPVHLPEPPTRNAFARPQWPGRNLVGAGPRGLKPGAGQRLNQRTNH